MWVLITFAEKNNTPTNPDPKTRVITNRMATNREAINFDAANLVRKSIIFMVTTLSATSHVWWSFVTATLNMRFVLAMTVLLLRIAATTPIAVAGLSAEMLVKGSLAETDLREMVGLLVKTGLAVESFILRGPVRRAVIDLTVAGLSTTSHSRNCMMISIQHSIEVRDLLQVKLVRIVESLIIEAFARARRLPTSTVLVMTCRLMEVSFIQRITTAANVPMEVTVIILTPMRLRAATVMSTATSTATVVKVTDPVSIRLVRRVSSTQKRGDAVALLLIRVCHMGKDLARANLLMRDVEVDLAALGHSTRWRRDLNGTGGS
jgi:hypothetical protein